MLGLLFLGLGLLAIGMVWAVAPFVPKTREHTSFEDEDEDLASYDRMPERDTNEMPEDFAAGLMGGDEDVGLGQPNATHDDRSAHAPSPEPAYETVQAPLFSGIVHPSAHPAPDDEAPPRPSTPAEVLAASLRAAPPLEPRQSSPGRAQASNGQEPFSVTVGHGASPPPPAVARANRPGAIPSSQTPQPSSLTPAPRVTRPSSEPGHDAAADGLLNMATPVTHPGFQAAYPSGMGPGGGYGPPQQQAWAGSGSGSWARIPDPSSLTPRPAIDYPSALPRPGTLRDSQIPSVRPDSGANVAPFDEGHYRNVYNDFIGSKRKLGEVVDNISFEGFSAKLRSSEKALIDRHGCRAVRFQVQIKDNQVSLRPQLVR
jgi:hypothetical protein